jgi:asparagine synthase (glutamine-hydrolysing)
MCGLIGIVKHNTCINEKDIADIRKGLQTLHRRGPDNQNVWAQGQVCLGHSLLAIQGTPPETKQPLSYKHLTLTMNGEIYNYSALKKLFPTYPFTSQSDAEVILPLYLNYGEKCLQRLDGEFAWALWDASRRVLHLCVDPLSIKPIFYTQTSQEFIFASTPSALLATQRVKRSFNKNPLFHALTTGISISEETFFNNIKKLPPGSILTLRADASLTIHSYRTYKDFLNNGAPSLSRTSRLEQTEHILSECVRKRLMGKSPIALGLSGGIDSALIAAFCKKEKNRFSGYSLQLGQLDKSQDEETFQQYVAKKTHCPLYVSKPPAIISQKELSTVLTANDNFSFHPVYFSQNFLFSQIARRQEAQVVLSGDGMDELFLGYPYYQHALALAKKDSTASFFNFFSNHFYCNAAQKKDILQKKYFNQYSPTEQVIGKTLAPLVKNYFPHNPEKGLTLGELFYKLPQLINYLDQISSYYGLENRLPFLDPSLISWSLQLPRREKLRWNSTKYIIKKVASRYFSKEFAFRYKSGFNYPFSLHSLPYSQKKLQEIFSTVFAEKQLSAVFQSDSCKKLLLATESTCLSVESHQILVYFALWYNHHFLGIS